MYEESDSIWTVIYVPLSNDEERKKLNQQRANKVHETVFGSDDYGKIKFKGIKPINPLKDHLNRIVIGVTNFQKK